MTLPDGRSEVAVSLRERNICLLIAGHGISQGANAMAPIVISLALFDTTQSIVGVGWAVGARATGNLIAILAGGVAADRISRVLVLRTTSAVAGILQVLIAVCVGLDYTGLVLLLVLNALNGMLATASAPAAAAMIPQLIAPLLIRHANAATRIAVNCGTLIGAMTAGLAVSIVGPGWAIGINAATFLLAGLLYCSMDTTSTTCRTLSKVSMTSDIREGWAEFMSRTWLWVIVVQFMVINAITAGVVQVLGPVLAQTSFGSATWGFLLATQTVGGLMGDLIAAHTNSRHALRTGVAASALKALPLFALAGTSNSIALALAMIISGAALELFAVAWDVALQTRIPNERLARIYSLDTLGSTIAIPPTLVLIGPVATALGTPVTLIGSGGAVAAITGFALCVPSVRRFVSRH